MAFESPREHDDAECLAEDIVFQFVNGQIAPDSLGAIEAHLACCGECRTLVAELAAPEENDADTTIADDGPALEDTARMPQPGETVGRYRVSGAIGMGGMGVVFLATDPTLNRRVTLKLLRADRRASHASHGVLLREAQSMAKLAHPNVVSVYDAGTFDDQVFMAMEFVEGSTLGAWLTQAPRSWREVLAVFLDAGRGLAAAHAEGILHRDFKPSNVLVGKDGRARVTDFGLARAMTTDGGAIRQSAPAFDEHDAPPIDLVSLTRTGAVKGTPGYMAPEQQLGRHLDARADQFSFCVALYEGFYGQSPFEGRDSAERAAAAREGRVRPPPHDDTIPRGLHHCVVKGMAIAPDARHASMNDLLVALETEADRASRRGGTRRQLGLILASACALIGAGSLAVTRWPSAPEAASAAPEPRASAAPAIQTAAAAPAPPEPSALASALASAPSAAPRKTTHAAPRSSAPKPPPRHDELMEPGFARKK